jgi:hypothetical protein
LVFQKHCPKYGPQQWLHAERDVTPECCCHPQLTHLRVNARHIRLFIFTAGTFLMLLSYCYSETYATVDIVTVNVSDSETYEIRLANGSYLDVVLPVTLGAGVSWSLTSHGQSNLTLLRSHFASKQNGEPLMGGPEMQIFRFKVEFADSATEDQLLFSLGRPWDDAVPERSVAIDVTRE